MSLPAVKPSFNLWRRSQPDDAVEAAVAPHPVPPALRAVLLIGDLPARPLAVEVARRLVLGRGKPDEGEGPDVDLTAFGAQHFGVSRRHAALVRQEGALYVEDLHSMNGTRLNGLPLGRGARVRLRNNDELELGSLRLVVRALPAPR